jgi:uncharacterized membrane protein
VTTTTDDRSTTSGRALGLFSIGLGAAQLAKPGALARAVGVKDNAESRTVMLGAGLRELGHGLAILRSPTAVWTRVAGDAFDLAVLGRALRGKPEDRRKLLAATAAVAGVTVADILTTVRLRRGGSKGSVMHETAAITIRKDAQELYQRWRDFASFPSFMYHLESVTVGADGRSHWVAKAPLGQTVEWDAEVTEERPGEVIAWRSIAGSEVDNSGRVSFTPAPGDQGTEVHVEISYDAPGGAIGAALAKLFGEEPRQQVKDDLHRFKQIVETGEVVRSEGTPEGEHASRLLNQRQADPVGGTR